MGNSWIPRKGLGRLSATTACRIAFAMTYLMLGDAMGSVNTYRNGGVDLISKAGCRCPRLFRTYSFVFE
jgi:hypothetical protein